MAARSLHHHHLLLLLFLFLLAGSLSPSPAAALRFDLQSGHTKCISDDIKVGAMAVGKYHVVAPEWYGSSSSSSSSSQPLLPESHRVSLRVTSPYGNSLHFSENVQSGNFAFTASEAGDYLACFWAPDHRPPATVGFEFDWRSGVSARDWTNVAKKGQVDMMEVELKKLEDTIKSIHEEMFYLRAREEEMQELNRRTNSRMAWLGFFSLAICLSVAGLQLWHLKNFFERKKLL
uniref:GOLD domain-containing protein n=1 Tax=Oryza meridionalis TaxID=40149 RepID=A0A0E0D1D9_9ORYZ